MKTSNESGIPIFVPECQADGNYVEVQCHKGIKYILKDYNYLLIWLFQHGQLNMLGN